MRIRQLKLAQSSIGLTEGDYPCSEDKMNTFGDQASCCGQRDGRILRDEISEDIARDLIAVLAAASWTHLIQQGQTGTN